MLDAEEGLVVQDDGQHKKDKDDRNTEERVGGKFEVRGAEDPEQGCAENQAYKVFQGDAKGSAKNVKQNQRCHDDRVELSRRTQGPPRGGEAVSVHSREGPVFR